jgi:oligopeptide/dipeptide ABC transporter ATP-binding protein
MQLDRENSPLLQVENLKTYFFLRRGTVRAVDGVSFQVCEGESVAIVGESGSGKTVTSLSIMGLVPRPGQVVAGTVMFRGQNLLDLRKRELGRLRGRQMAMIFQNPTSSLNPVFTIGRQLTETVRVHLGLGERAARERAVDMLERVGIPEAAQRLRQFPHQFSGGMIQRMMIAMALSCGPSLLIADEPTTALDVTIQAQIVELVHELKQDLSMAILWITHDLGVVASLADRVLVMYAGRIVEMGPVEAIYGKPRHPYTVGLLGSIPLLTAPVTDTLSTIEGAPPDLVHVPPGCAFAPRCAMAQDHCRQELPPLHAAGAPEHSSACWRWQEVGG